MEKKMEVSIPMIPRYIKVGGQGIGIDKFSDEELQEIGKEWTKKLIKEARNPKNFPKE